MSAATLAALRADALQILRNTLADCSIPAAMARNLRCEGTVLHRLRGEDTGSAAQPHAGLARDKTQLNLAKFSSIFLVAIGKAACPMLESLLAILPCGLPLRGVCAAPALPDNPHPQIRYYAAGHPLPNADSFAAARATLELLREADGKTLVIFLISGGGSALCELPLDASITLEETQAFHRALIGCGASITEINAIRQRFSAVKGGRLAQAAEQAAQLSLFVSDVPAGHLDALASGPTLPPRQTAAIPEILSRYGLLAAFPPAVRRFFERPLPYAAQIGAQTAAQSVVQSAARAETDPAVSAALRGYDLLLSSEDVALAAQRHARALGYQAVIENRCDDWAAEDAAQFLLEQLASHMATAERVCVISTGEVTVRLGPSPGTGGRNQHFALELARLLELTQRLEPAQRLAIACPTDTARALRTTVVLSVGTDGIDGNSPAAGAIADALTFARATQLGLSPAAALREHNAWPLFQALGDSIVTGATGNNLRDLRLLLSAR